MILAHLTEDLFASVNIVEHPPHLERKLLVAALAVVDRAAAAAQAPPQPGGGALQRDAAVLDVSRLPSELSASGGLPTLLLTS